MPLSHIRRAEKQHKTQVGMNQLLRQFPRRLRSIGRGAHGLDNFSSDLHGDGLKQRCVHARLSQLSRSIVLAARV